jgi:hypothetical protein
MSQFLACFTRQCARFGETQFRADGSVAWIFAMIDALPLQPLTSQSLCGRWASDPFLIYISPKLLQALLFANAQNQVDQHHGFKLTFPSLYEKSGNGIRINIINSGIEFEKVGLKIRKWDWKK